MQSNPTLCDTSDICATARGSTRAGKPIRLASFLLAAIVTTLPPRYERAADGINVFVLHSVRPNTKLRTISAGLTPFTLADTVRLALLSAFPGLVLWLPQALK